MSNHDIRLIPAQRPDGTIRWTMDYDGKHGNSPSNYPEIELLKNSGSHHLIFTIENPAGLSINFDPSMVQVGAQSIHNAFWAQRNSKPLTAVLHEQIKSVKIDSTKMTMNVHDKNQGTPKTLVYQINFVDTANPAVKVTPLDPEIKNGGGHAIALQNYVAIAAGVLAVAIAIFVVRRLLGRRNEGPQG